ncbi:MAG: ATP-binding protein, partial [Candidatus Thorarchaeota archaeon]
MMTEEEVNDPWISWVLKGLAALFLALLPATGILGLFMLVPWVPADWAGPTMLLSCLIFLVGAGILITAQDVRNWLYSIVIGYVVAIGSIGLVILEGLSRIPVPLVGNAFYATVIVASGILFVVGWFWPMRQDASSDPTKGLVTTSTKSFGLGSTLGTKTRGKAEKVLAVELTEIPHNYTHSEDEKQNPAELIECFHSIARALTSVPFGWRIQRMRGTTRILFFTWSKDEVTLHHYRTLLLDAVQNNLKDFNFEVTSMPEPTDGTIGAAAVINGVPLSIKEENQNRTPLEMTAGVLQQLDNGMFQVFIEPYKISKSKLKGLENEYRRLVERSETTVSKENQSWFGPQQESKTTVNPKAKRDAKVLERQIERLSNPNLHRVTVTAVSWGRNITNADLDMRRITNSFIGALRPDNDQEEFTIEFKRKQKDLTRLMVGLPIGKSSILTSDQVAGYLVIPRKDMGIRIVKRESFSIATDPLPEPPMQPIVQTKPFKQVLCKWIHERDDVIILGNPMTDGGTPLAGKFEWFRPQQFESHFGIYGNVRSGKTTTALSLAAQATKCNLKTLILVPRRSNDWTSLTYLNPDLWVFTAGAPDVAPLRINIFRPPKGVSLSKWMKVLVDILSGWLPNDRVMSMHFDDIVHTVYRNCGWKSKGNVQGRPILLSDLWDAVEEVGTSLDYGDELRQNFYGALYSRITSMLRNHAIVDMYNTEEGVTFEELASNDVLIDMEGLPEQDRALLMGVLAAGIHMYKMANPTREITNVLFLEEASYLLQKPGTQDDYGPDANQMAIDRILDMLTTAGGNGLGVVLIEQLPGRLVDDAVKLVVNVIVHAIGDEEERKIVGGHIGVAEDRLDHIRQMRKGETLLHLEGQGIPKSVKILPLDKHLDIPIPTQRVTGDRIKQIMGRVIAELPHINSNVELPDTIMSRVDRSKPVDPVATDRVGPT